MRKRIRSLALLLAVTACIAAGFVGAQTGCIVAPPPELPIAQPQPPRILHDSVMPPEGTLLAWPDGSNSALIVPVLVDDPIGIYSYRVFVDPAVQSALTDQPMDLPRVNDGLVTLNIVIDAASHGIDLRVCHWIKLVVAHGFVGDNPESVGFADTAWWHYQPAGAPDTCLFVEGGTTVSDASAEGLPIPPQNEAGGER